MLGGGRRMTLGEILKPPLNRPKPLNLPLILGDIFDFLRLGMSIVGSLLGEGLDPCARLLTRCVPFTSYLLTAKRLVLGALLLWGAPGGVQPVPAGTLDAARRRLPFFAALRRHLLVCGPEQLLAQQHPGGRHSDRAWAADGAQTAVSAPAGRGSHFA